MHSLATLTNSSRGRKPCRRVGRGPGSGLGKTSGRGQKGEGARSGSKRRHTYEGGQARQFEKLPTRGFTRGRWKKEKVAINLRQVDKVFSEGETVNEESLRQHGFVAGPCHGIKILGDGELTKKLSFEVNHVSESAKSKIEAAGSTVTIL